MIIPFVLGQTHTATSRGAVWRSVRCHSCGSEYVYRLKRTSECKGFSFLWLDDEGARNRAAGRAKAVLERSLKEECDPVACPACGMYQPDMVRLLRTRKWSIASRWAMLVFLVHMMFALVHLMFGVLAPARILGGYEVMKVWLAPPLGFVWMGALAILLGARAVRRMYDPNDDAASHVSNTAVGPDGPFRNEEFEQRMAEAAETTRQAEDSAKRPEGGPAGEARLFEDPSGQWVCSACGTMLAPEFMGDCPVCGRSL